MFVHGKGAVVTIDGDPLTGYSNSIEWARSADSHDVTTYGKDDHVFGGGLGNGTATITGIYDSTALTGPRAILEPLEGTVVELVYRPEGTGTGKPERTVDVLVTGYTETVPVADMITWQVTLQMSDAVVTATQA